jgi:arylsulfatase A-like enzyme
MHKAKNPIQNIELSFLSTIIGYRIKFIYVSFLTKKVNRRLIFVILVISIMICSLLIYESIGRKLINLKSNKAILCPHCNLIVVSIDTLRSDHLPCYGYFRNTAPNICLIGEKSALFENFIVHSYLTPMSQMSIFTSQYPSTNGITSFFSVLKPDTVTLAEVLSNNGYKTAAFGSSPEVISAFHIMPGNGSIPTPEVDLVHAFGRGFDIFKDTDSFFGARQLPTMALDWLANNTQQPFFLWIPMGTVHWPYASLIPTEFRSRFDPIDYEGILSDKVLNYGSVLSKIYKKRFYLNGTASLLLTDKDTDYVNARYDAGIYYTDSFVGALWQQLQQLKLDKNTLVVIYGVHGEDLMEHGYFTHYDIYDTEVKTPLIVYVPKAGSKRIKDQVRAIDLAPTILDLLNVSGMKSAQGKSLLPLTNDKHLNNLTAFIERIPLWEEGILRFSGINSGIPIEYRLKLNELFRNITCEDTAIRTKDWKLIHRMSAMIEAKISWWAYISGQNITRPEFELYNLKDDPYEQENLIEKYPVTAKNLINELARWENLTLSQKVKTCMVK